MVAAEYKVSRCSRRCFVEERNLRDGEWYYSVVIEDGEELIRRDYSAGAWTEPPAGTIGWWKSRMPEAGARKMVLAPEPVLVDHLRRMEGDEARGPLRYLLALTLLRRRIVRCLASGAPFELAGDLPDVEADAPPVGATGRMRLQVLSDGSELDVIEYEITRRQTESLSEALQELLYCEATDG
jgi:hypothetical protein